MTMSPAERLACEIKRRDAPIQPIQFGLNGVPFRLSPPISTQLPKWLHARARIVQGNSPVHIVEAVSETLCLIQCDGRSWGVDTSILVASWRPAFTLTTEVPVAGLVPLDLERTISEATADAPVLVGLASALPKPADEIPILEFDETGRLTTPPTRSAPLWVDWSGWIRDDAPGSSSPRRIAHTRRNPRKE